MSGHRLTTIYDFNEAHAGTGPEAMAKSPAAFDGWRAPPVRQGQEHISAALPGAQLLARRGKKKSDARYRGRNCTGRAVAGRLGVTFAGETVGQQAFGVFARGSKDAGEGREGRVIKVVTRAFSRDWLPMFFFF